MLMKMAVSARARAYCPYSALKVGAAILAADGTVFLGANIENASYGLTVCAERAAAIQAVMVGNVNWRAMAVAFAGARPCPPCGACCQFLAEFATAGMVVAWGRNSGAFKTSTLKSLLPSAFHYKKGRNC